MKEVELPMVLIRLVLMSGLERGASAGGLTDILIQ